MHPMGGPARDPESVHGVVGGGLRTALLLDMDGTLVDCVYQQVAAWGDALTAVGITIPMHELHGLMGQGAAGARMALEKREIRLTALEWSAAVERQLSVMSLLTRGVREIPGARELLETAVAEQRPIAVVTGSPRHSALAWFERFNWPKVPIVSSVERTPPKPHPASVLEALSLLRQPNNGAVLVGDTRWDMLAAAAAGVRPIGVLTGGRSREELLAAGATCVVDGISDLVRQ